MNYPAPDDYIDIHNHGGSPLKGRFCVENLMAHERAIPGSDRGIAHTYGIHPWFLTPENLDNQMERVRKYSLHPNVIAIGEAGFDKLKGPEINLQREAFEEQVIIAEERSKPVFIHCVRAWDELLASHKKLRPERPWLIHGFRGKRDLAHQLISKGMYISFWFDFIIRPETSDLVRNLPADRIFLETDGSGTDIVLIYNKVADDLGVDVIKLKEQINSNYKKLFCI